MKAFKHPSDSAAHEIYLKYSKYGKYIYIYIYIRAENYTFCGWFGGREAVSL